MLLQRLIFGKHLEEGETIFFAVHTHWIEILRSTLEVAFFGFILPWGLYLIGFNQPLFFWIAVVWSSLAYLRYLYVLLDWHTDTWLVTSSNIIVIQWNGFFHSLSSRVEYNDVEGVGYEIKGFWATVLGYGDLTLKLMSGNLFTLKRVASPKKMERQIMYYHAKMLEAKSWRDSEGIKEILSGMVATHMRKKLK
ncbi:hypothetical protein HZA43_00180 [Candidatus Peregrinibacteria bacterium]|nr:hypothetical protein [Candidatus Peregrinibacteria bacterium]